MADYEPQDQDDNGQSQMSGRNHYQQFPQRSTASANWRMKDGAPRAEPQPRQQRPSGGLRQNNSYGQGRETSDTRLYVGNLLYSAKKDDISQFFADNGFTIANISMSIDPMTGRNPSYCFVDFDSPEDASRAMAELNGKDVLGRTVRINPGMKRSEGQQSMPQAQQTGGFSRGGGWSSGQRDSGRQSYSYNRENQQGQYAGSNQQGQEQTKRLYVGNLPAIESPEEVDGAIHSLFDPLNIEIVKISNLIVPHESKQGLGGDHHFLFVDLARPEDVDAAIEALDGKGTPWNAESMLRVNKAREQVRRQGYGQGGYQSGGGYQNRRTEGQRDWRTAKTEEQ